MSKPMRIESDEEAHAGFIVKARGLASVVRELVIRNAMDYEDAGELRKQIHNADKAAEDYFGPMKASAHAAWKAVCAKEGEVRGLFKDCRAILDGKLLAYQREQEEKVRLEQEKARQLAEEQRRAQAKVMEEAGMAEAAEAILEAPVAVAPPLEIPKIAGLSTRKTLHGQVDSLPRAVIWIVTGKDPGEGSAAAYAHPELTCLIQVDSKALDAMIRAQRGTFNIPGVRVVEERTYTQRG